LDFLPHEKRSDLPLASCAVKGPTNVKNVRTSDIFSPLELFGLALRRQHGKTVMTYSGSHQANIGMEYQQGALLIKTNRRYKEADQAFSI
jgi:hypothetical protein